MGLDDDLKTRSLSEDPNAVIARLASMFAKGEFPEDNEELKALLDMFDNEMVDKIEPYLRNFNIFDEDKIHLLYKESVKRGINGHPALDRFFKRMIDENKQLRLIDELLKNPDEEGVNFAPIERGSITKIKGAGVEPEDRGNIRSARTGEDPLSERSPVLSWLKRWGEKLGRVLKSDDNE